MQIDVVVVTRGVGVPIDVYKVLTEVESIRSAVSACLVGSFIANLACAARRSSVTKGTFLATRCNRLQAIHIAHAPGGAGSFGAGSGVAIHAPPSQSRRRLRHDGGRLRHDTTGRRFTLFEFDRFVDQGIQGRGRVILTTGTVRLLSFPKGLTHN